MPVTTSLVTSEAEDVPSAAGEFSQILFSILLAITTR